MNQNGRSKKSPGISRNTAGAKRTIGNYFNFIKMVFISAEWKVLLSAYCIFPVLFSFSKTVRANSDPSFDIQNFRFAPSPSDMISTERAEGPGHLGWGVEIGINYGHDLLVVKELNESKWVEKYHLIEHRLQSEISGIIGVLNLLQFGLRIPAVLYQAGESATDPRINIDNIKPAAFGDIDLNLKVFLPYRLKNIVGLGFSASIGVPSGGTKRFAGDGMVTASPAFIFDFDFGMVDFIINFGYRYRDGGEVYDLHIGQELFANSALGINIREFHFIGQASWRGSINRMNLQNHNPLELTGAFRYNPGKSWVFTAGAGASLTDGYGAPDLRVFVSAGYINKVEPPPADVDLDGIPNELDRCPDEKEDMDGFEDSDGCPDKDNDGDGVPDKKDRCPNEKEDKDGFMDKDGCPDPDNDNDGFMDDEDKCPNEAEVVNNFEDNDGCPEKDSDSDGVFDQVDRCPGEKEDMDGFEDDDGCPEPDNDGDGILDSKDECPNEPETFNGTEDEDGCPDKARITGCEIKIKETIYFKTASAEILQKSFELLKEVASIIKSNPDIGIIRIEGHTDNKGSDETNLELSNKRAQSVKDFLVKEGVNEKNLVAVGFGETKPIADNKTKRGRAINRRVEFHIEKCEGKQNEEKIIKEKRGDKK